MIDFLLNNKETAVLALSGIMGIQEALDGISVDLNALPVSFYDRLYARALEADYVNEIGYDIVWNGYKVSCKSMKKMFQVEKQQTNKIIMGRKMRKGETPNGNYKNVDNMEYEYICLFQTKEFPYGYGPVKKMKYPSLAIAEYPRVKHLIKQNNSLYEAQIPFDLMTFIITPEEKVEIAKSDKFDTLRSLFDGRFVDELWLDILTAAGK